MWEFLLKINPKFIRYYKKNDSSFDYMMGIALEKGYIPTLGDMRSNFNIRNFINKDEELIEKVIRKNPRSLTQINSINDKVASLAIKSGYNPKVRDLRENTSLARNSIIITKMIEKKPKNIIYYEGNDKKIIEKAFKLGWFPTKRDIRKSFMLSQNGFVIQKMIEKNPKNILLYTGGNVQLAEEALRRGYVPKLRDIKKNSIYSYNEFIMRDFIKKDSRNIVFYRGQDESLIRYAMELGYVPTVSDVINHSLSWSELVMGELIKQNPRNIIFYKGHNEPLIKEALRLGYIPTRADIEKNINFFASDEVMKILIQKNPNYIVYYNGRDLRIVDAAVKLGYIPKAKDVEDNYLLSRNDNVILKLIEQDPKNITLYKGNNAQLTQEALKRGYIPTVEDIKNKYILAINDEIIKKLVEIDPNTIIFYKGTNQAIFNLAIEKGYKPNRKDLFNYKNLRCSDQIMLLMIEERPNDIVMYTGENQEVIKKAIEKGYHPDKKDLNKNHILARSQVIMDVLLREDILTLNTYKLFGDDAMRLALETFRSIYRINVPDYYAEILRIYKGDLSKFCLNYDKFSSFLVEIGIDEEKFFQYGFSKSYNWLDDMIKIVDSGKVDEFKRIKDYFFENYYTSNTNTTAIIEVNSFFNILKNYSIYPELCNDIIAKNHILTQEEIMILNLVFGSSNILDEKNRPKNIDDLGNVALYIKGAYKDKLTESSGLGLDVMKNTMCQLLFDANYPEVQERLFIYGNTEVLRQLMFNNRTHPQMEAYIRKMMICTSMMEAIVDINDPQVLRTVVERVLDNFEEVTKLSTQFSGYEEDMRYLYETDIQNNLTRFDNIQNPSVVIDAEKTKKYGVEFLDFSDKKYCLLAHVMSARETPEELIDGKVIGNKNFISLTPITNRNQVYYKNPGEDKIIFATDILPNGLFLQSSVTNMGTNTQLATNEGEIDNLFRSQRGVVETSHAPKGNNSEILTYRADLKFNYIILPSGREPTEAELALAREHGLKFVGTQEVRETVINPVEIVTKSETEEVIKQVENQTEQMSKQLFSPNNRSRKIAILTDAHGLFEPTLAVLEDSRRKGITEIYSLGDNVGTGPNPSEVMDLLDEYGVISLSGNHELYISEGVDAFRRHLEKTNAYDETKKNSGWTASKLSEEQKQKLRMFDKTRELIVGGKKILLCHDIKDFNSGEFVINTEGYDEVFRGHTHFSRSDDNITTIPGVGVGTNRGRATYLILTENEGTNGGYTSEIVTVGYDRENMRYDINESGMSDWDKTKIGNWAGVSDGTRKK